MVYNEDLILETANANPGIGVAQLVTRLLLNTSTVTTLLYLLQMQGKVRKVLETSSGVYHYYPAVKEEASES